MSRKKNNSNSPDIIDAEWETVSSSGGQLAPTQPTVVRAKQNTVRSNIQDGGYFDASGKRRPIFVISTADDDMASLMAIKAYLSAFRHRPVQTFGVTLATWWFSFAGASGALNMLRGDVVTCSGDNWNPVVAGCNIAATIAGPSQGLAGGVHDVILGQDEVTEDIQTTPKIRAVRVEN